MPDYAKLRVTELKQLLKSLELSTSGRKIELIQRLEAYDASNNEEPPVDEHDTQVPLPWWLPKNLPSLIIVRTIYLIFWILGSVFVAIWTDSISFGWNLPVPYNFGWFPLAIYHVWNGIVISVEMNRSENNSLLQIAIQGTTNLPRTGITTHLRHPFLSSSILFVIAEAIALGSQYVLIWLCMQITTVIIYVYFVEEPFLKRHFGLPYKRYQRTVSAFIPHRNLFNDLSGKSTGYIPYM